MALTLQDWITEMLLKGLMCNDTKRVLSSLSFLPSNILIYSSEPHNELN